MIACLKVHVVDSLLMDGRKYIRNLRRIIISGRFFPAINLSDSQFTFELMNYGLCQKDKLFTAENINIHVLSEPRTHRNATGSKHTFSEDAFKPPSNYLLFFTCNSAGLLILLALLLMQGPCYNLRFQPVFAILYLKSSIHH